MSTRMRVLGALAAVVAAVGVGVWLLIPPTRFAYGVAPIARGEAVLLTRRNDDDDTTFWVQRTRSDGTVVWDTELQGFATAEALGYSGVAATDDRIVLLGERDGATYVRALDRERGGPLWETRIDDGEPIWIGDMLHIDGPRVYVVHGERGDLTALALADGAVLWRGSEAALAGNQRIRTVMVLAADRPMVVTVGAPPLVLDGSTGAVVRSLPMDFFVCATPDAILGTRGSGFVRSPILDDGAAHSSIDVPADRRPSLQGPCGTREGDVVVTADSGTAAGGTLMRVDPSGHTRWTLPIPPGLLARHATQDGRLPRHFPVIGHGEDSGQRTSIADLDLGTIVGQHDHADFRMAFLTDARAYVFSIFDGEVFAVDPDDGSLARATRFADTYGNEVVPQDYRFGELWLYGVEWGRPDELGWAVIGLDARGEIQQSGTMWSTDISAAGWAGG